MTGSWTSETGGNRSMGTWITNPKISLQLTPSDAEGPLLREVFVGLSIMDSRLRMGFDYFKVCYLIS